jgi:3-dehydroquinate synthetase
VTGLNKEVTARVKKLLSQYHLPVKINIEPARAMELIRADKKRTKDSIDYIVLEKIGKAAVHKLPLTVIEKTLNNL